jgi:hypothetical protein
MRRLFDAVNDSGQHYLSNGGGLRAGGLPPNGQHVEGGTANN